MKKVKHESIYHEVLKRLSISRWITCLPLNENETYLRIEALSSSVKFTVVEIHLQHERPNAPRWKYKSSILFEISCLGVIRLRCFYNVLIAQTWLKANSFTNNIKHSWTSPLTICSILTIIYKAFSVSTFWRF